MTRSFESTSESPSISEQSVLSFSPDWHEALADKFGEDQENASLKAALKAVMSGDVDTLKHMAPYAENSMSQDTQAAFRKALESAGFRVSIDSEAGADVIRTLFGNITIIPPGSNEGLSLTFHGSSGRPERDISKVEAVNVSQTGQVTESSVDNKQIEKQIQAIRNHVRKSR